jgi:hypothetical protein
MKRLLAMMTVGVLLCISSAARAERSQGSRSHAKHVLVGLDTEFGIPLGDYSDVNSVGGGALVVGEYPMMNMLGLTARLGFQAHVNRTIGTGLNAHVNAIPFLFGTKYYVGGEREGLFGAFELGLFDLMSSVDRRVGGVVTTATSNDLKFGMGAGVGYQEDRWNARVSVHTQDVGNFGSAMTITGGIGYQFAAF